jgi:hypothetical protein
MAYNWHTIDSDTHTQSAPALHLLYKRGRIWHMLDTHTHKQKRTCSMNEDASMVGQMPSMTIPSRCAENMAFMHAMYCPAESEAHCSTKMRLRVTPAMLARLTIHMALLRAADSLPGGTSGLSAKLSVRPRSACCCSTKNQSCGK